MPPTAPRPGPGLASTPGPRPKSSRSSPRWRWRARACFPTRALSASPLPARLPEPVAARPVDIELVALRVPHRDPVVIDFLFEEHFGDGGAQADQPLGLG